MIAIISDVHGNYPALKSVLEEIDRIGCDTILSLGDVSGYYCMINECVDEFRHRNIINLMGNHDSYILGKGFCPRSTTVNLCIDYQKQVITQENLRYLSESNITLDSANLSARHGGWNDPIDEYIEKFNFSLAENYQSRIFCSGHTHVQKIEKYGEYIYFNPGAVGQPRDNDPRAAFAILNGDELSLYRVEYDIDEIASVMNKNGFAQRVYECLYKGTKIGG